MLTWEDFHRILIKILIEKNHFFHLHLTNESVAFETESEISDIFSNNFFSLLDVKQIYDDFSVKLKFDERLN